MESSKWRLSKKIEDVGEMIEINGNPQPVIKKREANSFVSVNDQEVIILGGLQSLRTAKSVGSNGLISMIPIVSNILGNHDKDSNVKELIIFLKPYVINNVDEAGKYTRDQIGKLTHGDDIDNFTENGAFKTLEDITDEEKKAGNRIKEWLGFHKDL